MSDSTPSISATFAHSQVQRVIAAAPALQAATAAVQAASDLGVSVNVALVDAAGVLAAFVRMPGAPLHSIDIAIDKAYTAASFGLSTAQWVDLLEDRGASNLRHVPRVMAAAGGFPIMEDGAIIGGIGISGGSWAQDQEAGEEALSNFSK